MKSVTIEGRTLQYETKWYSMGEYGEYPVTIFYEGTETVTKRTGFLGLGPKVTKEVPKQIFKIHEDSKNTELTKDWWKKAIEHELELLDRKAQIERGELI